MFSIVFVTHSGGLFTLEWTHPAIQACLFHTIQRSRIKLVRPLSTVDNTRESRLYARVSHSRQWSNWCNILGLHCHAVRCGCCR